MCSNVLQQLARRLTTTTTRNTCSRNTLKIKESIESQTRISREHLTPEIQLHLLTPDCPLYSEPKPEDLDEHFQEPFWSIYWPGGQALTRYILDEGPRLFSKLKTNDNGIKVLDLGSGCAASAIAAKMIGAKDVLANDIDEVACLAASMNAQLNNVDIRVSSNDLIGSELSEQFDFILIGDLLYDEVIATKLETWLDNLIVNNNSLEVLVGDPGRHGLTSELRRKLQFRHTYQLPENVRRENHGYNEATVWKYLNPRILSMA